MALDRRRERRRYARLGADVGPTSATASSRWLARLSEDDRAALVRTGHAVLAPQGRPVSASAQDALVAVVRGVAASQSSTVSGSTVVTSLVGPGDTHGLTFVLGHPEIAEDLIALTDVEALAIPGAALRGLVDRAPTIASACLATLAEEHAASQGEIVRLAGSSATARVEQRLIELAERFGRSDGGRILVTVPLTQDVLASWSRTSRETCAKALFELRQAGIVTTGRRELIIEDLEALRVRRRGCAPTIEALLRGSG